jgi:hypothetical protein
MEPDYTIVRNFVDNRHRCVVIRLRAGWHCGYIGVPPTSPLYGLHYDDLGPTSVHGGMTYSGHAYWDAPENAGRLHFFGFDAAHAGDGRKEGDPGWKDADFMALHCRRFTLNL